MESIVEYFGSCLGVTKIPLAYVVQKEMVPEQAPISGWMSSEVEMVSQAPLVANVAAVQMVLAEHYKTDNKTVWTQLAKMCCNHDCWTFIHQHQTAKHGQLAFWLLYNHYLGAHNVDTLCAQSCSYRVQRSANLHLYPGGLCPCFKKECRDPENANKTIHNNS
jgi:hypothetical protein